MESQMQLDLIPVKGGKMTKGCQRMSDVYDEWKWMKEWKAKYFNLHEWTQSHVMQCNAVISYRTGAKIQPMPDWRWHPLTVPASNCWWSCKVHRIIEVMAMDVCCPGFRFHTVGLGEPWRGFATKPLTARVHGQISSLESLPCSWFTLNPVPANYTKQIQANSSCMMYSILTAKGASYSHYACIWGQLGSCTCEIESSWGFWPMSEDCRSCDSGSELRICLMKRRAVSNQVFTNRQPHESHALQVYNVQETCTWRTCKSQ